MGTPHPTRRRLLKLVGGVGGASVLAGCEYNYTPPPEPPFVAAEINTVPTVNFNPYDPLAQPPDSTRLLFHPLFAWAERKPDGSFLETPRVRRAELATALERDGNSYRIELDDRFTWHDGTPVTADDVLARWTLDRLAERRNWEYAFVDCHADGDHTVVLEVAAEANDALVEEFIAGTTVSTHPTIYSQFLPDDGARGAGAYDHLDATERARRRRNLHAFTVRQPGTEGLGEVAPVIGNGLWQLVESDGQALAFERHDSHPYSEDGVPVRVRFEPYGAEEIEQAILDDELDGVDAFISDSHEDDLAAITMKYDSRLGMGLAFNHDRFPDHRSRQAIAFMIDAPKVIEAAAFLYSRDGIPRARDGYPSPALDSGLYAARRHHPEIFGERILEKLTQYRQDTGRATALLDARGWSREDGQWYDEDGARVEISIAVPGNRPRWTEMVQAVAEQLSAHGIAAEARVEAPGPYYRETMPEVDYDIAAWWCGGGSPVPWVAYETLWNGWSRVSDTHNHPTYYEEVPGPIGEHNGAETFELDVREQLLEMARTRGATEELRERRRELCWAYNQLLPVYCVADEGGLLVFNTSEWATFHDLFQPLDYRLGRGAISDPPDSQE